MNASDFEYAKLQSQILPNYSDRAHSVSGQFLRWFMEEIFRLEPQDADDACVDSQLDKGIDGIFVSEQAEEIYLFQSKVRQKRNAKLGDKDIKEFAGSLDQFSSAQSISNLLDGNASIELKNCIRRTNLVGRIEEGFVPKGIFCTNTTSAVDAQDYLQARSDIELYDATRIANERIDIEVDGGIKKEFSFDVSDTEVIKYESKDGITARFFLAYARELVSLSGISDGELFEQNVRLSLGNTKINKQLLASVKNKKEHQHFPLYHNGITLLCEKIKSEDETTLTVKHYVIVNGAQSVTSLYTAKESITDDLRVLTKVVALKGDTSLAGKITYNSNNQNAIKARDLRSNHPVQARLQREIMDINHKNYRYEVKRGEDNQGFAVISNEEAGLILLAMDLGEPWSCHQKYRVMDDSHGRIFGQPHVNGYKIIGLHEAFRATRVGLNDIEDKPFSAYNLTKYFMSFVVSEIIKTSNLGKAILHNPKILFDHNSIDEFAQIFEDISQTVALDLNAEIQEPLEEGKLDYKASLKSVRWCEGMSRTLVSSYLKDVKRKKAEPVDDLLGFMA